MIISFSFLKIYSEFIKHFIIKQNSPYRSKGNGANKQFFYFRFLLNKVLFCGYFPLFILYNFLYGFSFGIRQRLGVSYTKQNLRKLMIDSYLFAKLISNLRNFARLVDIGMRNIFLRKREQKPLERTPCFYPWLHIIRRTGNKHDIGRRIDFL